MDEEPPAVAKRCQHPCFVCHTNGSKVHACPKDMPALTSCGQPIYTQAIGSNWPLTLLRAPTYVKRNIFNQLKVYLVVCIGLCRTNDDVQNDEVQKSAIIGPFFTKSRKCPGLQSKNLTLKRMGGGVFLPPVSTSS